MVRTEIRLATAVLVWVVASGASAQTVVHVRQGLASGANNGTSWADAFRGRLGLQAAINSVAPGSGSEVWVASGAYAPAGPGGDRNASFMMKSGIAILGGFAGSEATAAGRNPTAHLTVLTGDLNSNDGPGALDFIGDNSRHVVRAASVDATAIIDGVLIRDGAADNSFPSIDGIGAGLLAEGGSPTILNCTFRDCYSVGKGAGAALLAASAARFDGCVFVENRSDHKGAGAYVGPGGTGEFHSCEFRSNRGSLGVGLYSEEASPTIEDCLFIENLSDLSAVSGAGMFDDFGQPTLRRCDFIRNATIGGGGGVYLRGSQAYLVQCRFFGNVGSFDVGDASFVDGGSPTFVNCLMRGVGESTPTLLPDASGCIVHVNSLVGSAHATFINCTLAGNGRGIFGGPAIAAVLVQGSCIADFFNCVIWENTGSTSSVEEDAIQTNLDGMVTFDRCAVQGWTGMLPGLGNGAFDPLFASSVGADGVRGTVDDDIRLGAGSMCIDRGSNLTLPAGETLDIASLPRFRNDHSIPDTGVGTAPIVDLGTFEFQPPPCAGDANDDGVVDFGDITFVLAHWGSPLGFGAVTETLAQWGSACLP